MKKENKINELRAGEQGNALWFILLAVALMAALTVTVSRSTDTAEQSGNIERFRVEASDIMRHSSAVAQATKNMSMQGISENVLSFENDHTATDYSNANCTGTDCLVFGSAGGGVSYRVPAGSWLDSTNTGNPRYGEWEFSGTNSVPNLRSANPELIMYLGYLKRGLCEQINVMLDIPGGIPLDADGFDTTAYQGSFAATATIDNMDDLEAGCFEDDTGDRNYTYYQVLNRR